MNLPDGVSYHWRQRKDWKSLISAHDDGLIRLTKAAYQIDDHSFKAAIAPYLKGDWEDFDRLFQLTPPGLEAPDVVYSRAEHQGRPKQPNMMVVPNLLAQEWRGLRTQPTVFGCTMGHYHPGAPTEQRVQEVYEFQSYGLMLLDREQGEIELWVARDGDKVGVPNRCHMTLYNLGGEHDPLITLDFSDPDHNPTDEHLVRQCGPALLAYYDGFEAIFRLNRLYINNPEHGAGVRLGDPPGDLEGRQVRVPLGARLELGRHLYEQLTRNPDVIGRFARLGVRVRPASSEAWVEPLRDERSRRDTRVYFAAPLVRATRPGTRVYRYFFPQSGEDQPGTPHRNIADEEQKRAPRVPARLQALNRPLVIVVEGAGDWVQKAYRPVFQELAPRHDTGYNLSVIYVDDTRWTAGQPPDFVRELDPWEVYLDKAVERDMKRYRNLVPDVVFVVTPDFTHSEIARSWIDRTPLILVEKPFDSNLDNLDRLVRALGLSRSNTKVLGLDHYRCYAMPLRDLLPTVVDHLGGALTCAVCYVAESGEIDSRRIRSLQHGMTLDLLPHFLALLLFFGDPRTVDAISVVKAGQYTPPPSGFERETASSTVASFMDYSGNGYPVTCEAVVGKGFAAGAKYLEITGVSGNAVRIDLDLEVLPQPWPTKQDRYYRNSICFLQGAANVAPADDLLVVDDPYNPGRQLAIRRDLCWKPLDRDRYRNLVRDILYGTEIGQDKGIASAMSLAEARQIMVALERIWQAVQDDRPHWISYDLEKLTPVRWAACFNK